ncbi:hypothetical protein C9374_014169 [Naegleria lovaniensis]|uniref:Uncharacterized protein n=1 Tax=Naegleria lovaniensis TaxID=51637 RepID=A0AA88H1B2_NAELO|nr:uncharacterized protein C9374_014169 [Naegleria lovaniensis]KAG2389609.1 hypothetical protein C9374_014169 [Naegleria lovaniensis]
MISSQNHSTTVSESLIPSSTNSDDHTTTEASNSSSTTTTENNNHNNTTSIDGTSYDNNISLDEFSHLPKSLQNRLGALKLLKEKGNEFYRKEMFQEAVDEYDKIDRFMGVLFKKSESTPDELKMALSYQTAAQLNMAQSLMKMGKYSKALDHLEKAEEYNKELKDHASEKKIMFRRAKCYLDGIEETKGKELMQEVKEKYASEDSALVKLVDAELKKYKQQSKKEMQTTKLKGVFGKTELYHDMPEPVISTNDGEDLKKKNEEVLSSSQENESSSSLSTTSSAMMNLFGDKETLWKSAIIASFILILTTILVMYALH